MHVAVEPGEVLLDNGSTVNIIKDRKLLSNIRKAPQDIVVNGVGGQLKIAEVGTFGAFGAVYYSSSAPCNLLSFSKLRSSSRCQKIEYEWYTNSFVVTLGQGSRFRFRPTDGLYACNFNKSLYKSSANFIETVQDNLK